ncbi:hypothetical protein V6N11_031553 [Hibiscus sabdariffa]|uniref:Uncharacterized protein n=1 Tax=Hibiscus sabdariffa TaxID=183260 RepID=A0ABR2SYA2_9ROSI
MASHSALASESDDFKPSMISTFKLTSDQLNLLKAKAGAESGTKYTSFNILAAHICRCVTKARGLSDDQPVKIYTPVDGRSKLNPPLPPGFFGNAIFIAAVIAQAGDLKTESFSDTVKRIHEGLNQINDEYLRSAVDYTEKLSDLSALVRGAHTLRCKPNGKYLGAVTIVWCRFRMGSPHLRGASKYFPRRQHSYTAEST